MLGVTLTKSSGVTIDVRKLFKLVFNMTNAQCMPRNSLSDRPSFNFTYLKVTFLIGCLILCVLGLNSWNLEAFLVRELILWLRKAAEFLDYPSDFQAPVEQYVLRCYTFLNFPFRKSYWLWICTPYRLLWGLLLTSASSQRWRLLRETAVSGHGCILPSSSYLQFTIKSFLEA